MEILFSSWLLSSLNPRSLPMKMWIFPLNQCAMAVSAAEDGAEASVDEDATHKQTDKLD
jgi:hypothetical protein